jgi:hypothetical protein
VASVRRSTTIRASSSSRWELGLHGLLIESLDLLLDSLDRGEVVAQQVLQQRR